MADNFTRFEQRYQSPADPQALLFYGQQGNLTVADWLQRVADWQLRLQQAKAENPALLRCAVYHPDLAEFTAILFALWSQQLISCVPGANNPGTVEALAPLVDAFAGDFDVRTSKPWLDAEAGCGAEPLTALAQALDYHAPLLEIFTSGSSGEPKAIAKALRQMAVETTALEQLWGSDLDADSCSIGTVSHHHIYGMLYRQLWPLAEGRPMWRDTCAFIEDVSSALPMLANPSFLLVSSPTHLSRLPDNFDWQALRQHSRMIFSSGAPLPETASVESARRFDTNVNEILGSSETGGIAWRRQHRAEQSHWTPGPGIDVRVSPDNQCLEIRSPFLADLEWYATTDRVQLQPDNTFTLLGRTDRIAKVEGKRLSLTAMDQQLQQSPFIEEARSLVLHGHRDEVAAVLSLTEAGRQQLQQQGRKALLEGFKQTLLLHFERPLLPRKWRIVLEIPRNSQGKTLLQDLLDRFEASERWPTIMTEQRVGEADNPELQLDLQIGTGLRWFDGHFDNYPILPGVVQTDWAIALARRYLDFPARFCGMKNIKFANPIVPGDRVSLTLSLKARQDGVDLQFSYRSGDKANSSGAISFSVPAASSFSEPTSSDHAHAGTNAASVTGQPL
ncbi:AMP-binding protein [Oceanobacter mangrovi]|uniref:ApeI family dehydratase n=1 Tax=Oceanobacter mangrovi TaxID=2862510 RepID=UPI001C8EC558|nr:AMP-binding protein [Oceanobacter mangrovi]